MKTKRLWVVALAAMFVFSGAQARDLRRGKECKKCQMEQRFQRDRQFRGQKCICFNEVRFKDLRFMEVKAMDPRFREQMFRKQQMEKARLAKKNGHKHHHRR